MKRVVAMGDTHCGHRAGLTPPGWWYELECADGERRKFAVQQRALWGFFSDTIKSLKPIDVLIVNGDAIDGKGERSGTTEQLEADRLKQVDMAVECIRVADAQTVVMTYGTPYHTGTDEDFEGIIAERVGATISGHEWIDVNGLIFDIKHAIGNSSIPHGKLTSIARARLWNTLWSVRRGQPRADVLLRAHRHSFDFCGDKDGLAIVQPCLEGWGSKYGVRMCEGTIDIGVLQFDVESRTKWGWKHHILVTELLTEGAMKV